MKTKTMNQRWIDCFLVGTPGPTPSDRCPNCGQLDHPTSVGFGCDCYDCYDVDDLRDVAASRGLTTSLYGGNY